MKGRILRTMQLFNVQDSMHETCLRGDACSRDTNDKDMNLERYIYSGILIRMRDTIRMLPMKNKIRRILQNVNQRQKDSQKAAQEGK